MEKIKKGKKFAFLKDYGFDNTAYFFDYLDPIFKNDIVAEFDRIYRQVFAYPTQNPKHEETITINGVVQPNNSTKQIDELGYDPWHDPYDVKNMDPKQVVTIDFSVHNVSISTVQLNQAINDFNWVKSETEVNPGRKLVIDYDFNNDGRLSPREFIIALIRSNDKIDRVLGKSKCLNCLSDFVTKIDAMFTFIDCDNNGLISSEDLWASLPNLRRPTKLWNFFTLANEATVKSAVTNDFILKNMEIVNGNLTKEEFRRGILLGFWDRQTDDRHIFNDDSRNLKKLRWRGNMVDITAERYINALHGDGGR